MGVIPVLNPTVPMALTCSNAMSKNDAFPEDINDPSVKVNTNTPTKFPTRKKSNTL